MGIWSPRHWGKIIPSIFVLLLLSPSLSFAQLTEASQQHLDTLRGMEIRLSKDPAKKAALEKVRSEIHRIEKEYRLPLTKFSASQSGTAQSAGATTHRRPQYQDFSEPPKEAKEPKDPPKTDQAKEESRQETKKESETTDSDVNRSNERSQSDGAQTKTEKPNEDSSARARAEQGYRESRAATEVKGRRVVGYDQFGRPEYQYDCQSSFSLFL